MADIFISYKSERRAAAEHLAEILADYGYTVWWDYSLVTGRHFGADIERELRAAKAVIVLWCSLSITSEWVLEEATLAKRLGRIVPVRIEKVDPPLGFSLLQTLDLTLWNGAPKDAGLSRLLRDIAEKIGRAPQSNEEGLARTERAWRRFGAPPLSEFALVNDVERNVPPRTLPSALMSNSHHDVSPPAPTISGAAVRGREPALAPKLQSSAESPTTRKGWNCINTLKGHQGAVKTAVMSLDGRVVVTASADATAQLWNAEPDGKTIASLLHRSAVYCAALSPDGVTAVTSCGGPVQENWVAVLWEAWEERVIFALKGHGGTVRWAGFSPNAKTVVTASDDRTARLWDVRSGRERMILEGAHTHGVRSARFSPSGQTVATASADRTVVFWDIKTGKATRRIEHASGVHAVDFAPDGQAILAACEDGTAHVWAVGPTSVAGSLVISGHERAVRSARFSPDGARLVTASEDRTARVWNAATGQCVWVIEGFGDTVNYAEFSSDSKCIVTGCADGIARIWAEV